MKADEMEGGRGMLIMGREGSAARCARFDCGWEGMPTFRRGVVSTHCPKCERESDEDMLALGEPPAPKVSKQGRNELCACGSGLKWKRCHGA